MSIMTRPTPDALALTSTCGRCGAASDAGSGACPSCGSPLAPLPLWWPQRSARQRWSERFRLDLGPLQRLVARAIASLVLLFGAFLSGGYFALFSVLGMPLGGGSLLGRGVDLKVALGFFVLCLVALVQCWRRPPFTALTWFTAAAAVVVPLAWRWLR